MEIADFVNPSTFGSRKIQSYLRPLFDCASKSGAVYWDYWWKAETFPIFRRISRWVLEQNLLLKKKLFFFLDDKLIHLDPHYCQEMVDVWAADFPLSSFHCRSPRKMHLSKMDPSCCIGFYCATKDDFFSLVETLQTVRQNTAC